MIILCTLLLAMLVAAAAITTYLVFKPKWPWMMRVIYVMVALSIAMGVAACIAHSVVTHNVNTLQEEYDNIMLYYNTVSNSPNEYVRYNFYNRVNEFNTSYEDAMEQSKSIWVGAFFDNDWSNEMAPIVFELHGDEYYAG